MHAEAQMDLEALRRSADSACRLMKVLSNPDRLLLLFFRSLQSLKLDYQV